MPAVKSIVVQFVFAAVPSVLVQLTWNQALVTPVGAYYHQLESLKNLSELTRPTV